MGIIPLAGVGGAHGFAFDFAFDFSASRGSGVQPQAFDFAFLPAGHHVLMQSILTCIFLNPNVRISLDW